MYNWEDYEEWNLQFINDDIIAGLNYRISQGLPTRIVLPNTKALDSEIFKKIINDEDLLQFRVVGGLDKEKYNNPKYQKRSTYTRMEMEWIVDVLEQMESTIDPNWSETQKAEHLFNKLANYLSYDMEYKGKSSNVTSSLKTLISGKAICAGYSLCFKELMDRQGIQCDYVRGRSCGEKHAWNVVTVDGVEKAVDVTWESHAIHTNPQYNGGKRYFGFSSDFANEHTPEPDERITNYSSKVENEVSNDLQQEAQHTAFICTRDDGTRFLLANITTDKSSGLFEYMQCEINDDGTLSKTNVISSEMNLIELSSPNQQHLVFNSLLAKNRIEKYVTNGCNGYVGYIGSDNKKYLNQDVLDYIGESKNYQRDDGTNITLHRTGNQPYGDKGINTYKCCEFIVDNNGYVHTKVDTIHSEIDISKNSDPYVDRFFATHSLKRSRIDAKVSSSAGYVGTLCIEDNRLKKAANPYTEDYIVRHQLINTSELKLSTLTVVNKEDYKFVQSTFEQNENSQTNNYTRGFINYKVLVCIAMIFSIVFLSYAFIKLYI